MKINNQLIKIVKKIEGNVLGFGLTNDKLLDTILDNSNILECNLLNLKGVSDDTSKEGSKLKYISVERLRKKFKKKKTNVILADIEEINHFLSSFIKDSIYLTKDSIYLFSKEKEQIEIVAKKYKRYGVFYKVIDCSDGVILNLDISHIKSSKFKDLKWSFVDKIITIIDFITEIISS